LGITQCAFLALTEIIANLLWLRRFPEGLWFTGDAVVAGISFIMGLIGLIGVVTSVALKQKGRPTSSGLRLSP
jgi:hypothetical protein